eukprot:TRINITY_DN9197_c0_g2_i1.p1 TRINITY_DN9197_c0_g2~~TRINITY_DN9197_c0_g2_i1.p1  ORF type:complete len:319 (+),score=30.16 TRINITY_DN9197_c0_g2_i1:87-1043(+)
MLSTIASCGCLGRSKPGHEQWGDANHPCFPAFEQISYGRRPVGAVDSELPGSSRIDVLEGLLQTDASMAANEAPLAARSCEFPLHPQCSLDFDRSDYIVGEKYFAAGEAAKTGRQTDARVDFVACMAEECGGSARLVYAASALASQLAMAHLSTVCHSGAHSYAIPSGCTLPRYTVRRYEPIAEPTSVDANRTPRMDTSGLCLGVMITIERVSEGFDHFSLPGDEPRECDSQSSIQHYARVLVEFRENSLCADASKPGKNETGDEVQENPNRAYSVVLHIQEAWESMNLTLPDRKDIVNVDSALDTRSSPLQRTLWWQ